VEANNEEWKRLQGRLILIKAPKRASVYLEGPSPGTDLLIDSFSITQAPGTVPAGPPIIEVSFISKTVKCKQNACTCLHNIRDNIEVTILTGSQVNAMSCRTVGM
jgi:hypothetical protein